MTRRVCLIAVANDILPNLLPILPKGVLLVGQKPCFDRSVTILRLEGDGLPEWCEEPSNGGIYEWASITVYMDGRVEWHHATPIQPVSSTTSWERIQEQSVNPN
jgi:hypothetical protein